MIHLTEQLHGHSWCEQGKVWEHLAKDRKQGGIAPIGNSTYLDLFKAFVKTDP